MNPSVGSPILSQSSPNIYRFYLLTYMTSRHDVMTCQSDVIFFEKKMKLASTHSNARELWKLNKTWIISIEHRNIMMTWHDSWQYVITWHTSHDVKARLHKHTIWHLTSSICRWAMILLLFRTVYRSRNTFKLSPIGWPSRMHSRVTLKLKVTSRSTWPLLSLLVFVLLVKENYWKSVTVGLRINSESGFL